MWKAWFILTWLSILTGKLTYLGRLIGSASYYCKYRDESYNMEYCCYKDTSQAISLSIMTILYIAVGLWIISSFPDTL